MTKPTVGVATFLDLPTMNCDRPHDLDLTATRATRMTLTLTGTLSYMVSMRCT